MKVYKAKTDQGNLIANKSYIGHKKGDVIYLTQVVSFNRVVQVYKNIIANPIHLELVSDNASVGLDPSAKQIARGNRGAK